MFCSRRKAHVTTDDRSVARSVGRVFDVVCPLVTLSRNWANEDFLKQLHCECDKEQLVVIVDVEIVVVFFFF